MARVGDLHTETIQRWMDAMAAADRAVSTMRVRQSALSSPCSWLVKRSVVAANPVAKMDRPPHRKEPPRQVPGPEIMDQLVKVARERRRPRDLGLLMILRFTGMRRESVARLCVRNLYAEWGLRGVVVKGGKTRDIPLPAVVMQYLHAYVKNVVEVENGPATPDTPLFWSSWGQRHVGKVRRPMSGKNIWRLCKQVRRADRLPGVEAARPSTRCGDGNVRAASRPGAGTRVARSREDRDHPEVYAQIQPEQLKQSVSFYEARALDALTS
jgi:site-specific recombinase XerD